MKSNEMTIANKQENESDTIKLTKNKKRKQINPFNLEKNKTGWAINNYQKQVVINIIYNKTQY
jgi:hypothetical protein